MAAYPTSVFSPYPELLEDNKDLVLAEHVNALRGEVIALETALGINPSTSTTVNPSDVPVTTATVFSNVASRIANLEKAALRDLGALYVLTEGGSIVGSRSDSGGIGIRNTSTVYAALEVLADDSGWSSDLERSTIRLWGTGKVDAKLLNLSSGADRILLDPSAESLAELGSTTLYKRGAATFAGRVLIDGAQNAQYRIRASVDSGSTTAMWLQIGASVTNSPLVITKAGASVFEVLPDGTTEVGGSLKLLADNAQVEVGTTTVISDSEVAVGSASLSEEGLNISTTTSLTPTGLTFTNGLIRMEGPDLVFRVSAGRKIRTGPSGVGKYSPMFMQYVETNDVGTIVTGSLALPDNPSYVWPNNSDATQVLWMDTLARQNGPSNLDPSYWGPFHTSPGGSYAYTEYTFIAPASNWVKITLQGEVYGNVSRSAVSYEIWDEAANTQVLTAGPSHALSFNAPVATQSSDFYYVNLSNVYSVALTGGRKYRVKLRCQRAIPGNDTVGQYFPGHSNYSWSYPWGRWFPTKHLRMYVEPMLSFGTWNVT